MVESGHNDGQYHQITTDNYGLPVLEEMNDFQDYAGGGDGYMMLFTFDTSANTLHVQTYSPLTGQYPSSLPWDSSAAGTAWMSTVYSNGGNYTVNLNLKNYVAGSATPGGAYPSTTFQNGVNGYNGETDTYIAGNNPW